MNSKRIPILILSLLLLFTSVAFAAEPECGAGPDRGQASVPAADSGQTAVPVTGSGIEGILETIAGKMDSDFAVCGPVWTEADWIAVMEGMTDVVLPFSDSSEVQLDICQTMIQNSFQYLGVPYVWGGKTPAGFDCSGFVNYVMAETGLWEPHIGCCNDLAKYCTVVDIADAQPGDLVFFSGTTSRQGYSHIAIYLGCGQVINSASSSGVSIADIRSGYWAHHFACVARPNVFMKQS